MKMPFLAKDESQLICDDLCAKAANDIRNLVARHVDVSLECGVGTTFAVMMTLTVEATRCAAGFIDTMGGKPPKPGKDASAAAYAAICVGILNVEDKKDGAALSAIAKRGRKK